MKKLLDEFKAFALMATAFKPVVDAFAQGVVMNIVAAIFGQPDFSSVGIDIGDSRLLIGDVINAFISFMMVAFVCFLIVKAYNAARKQEESGPSEVDLLTEIRDSLRNR
jgi:large conductance mechanosensitive channel